MMKHFRVVSVGIGVILGSSMLLGCGPRETTNEPLSEEPTADIEEPTPPTTDDSFITTDDEPTPIAKPPQAGGDRDATTINPPKLARLTAQQADAQINLRSQPTTTATAKGYGLVGDAVRLLRADEGEGGLTWYYVRFEESGAEGWIRGDFISTGAATARLQQGANVDIDSFTTAELFAVGSGGCGMTLWPVDAPNDYIFFNGLPGTGMWMQLDGEMTQFRQVSASGPEFYGQSASQSFVGPDGAIEVDVTVNVGSEAGYEAVNIERGTLQLEGPSGEVTEITVKGDAGC